MPALPMSVSKSRVRPDVVEDDEDDDGRDTLGGATRRVARGDGDPKGGGPPPDASEAASGSTSGTLKSTTTSMARRRQVLSNFMAMAVCFSLNHGTVTALIALASSSLGKTLGNVSSGVLYLVYTLTAAFCSNAMAATFGAKFTLFVGLGIYCVYVVSYLVAYLAPSTRWPAVLLGAVLGGFAAGSIWPAQGAYYARCADAYAEVAGSTREAANAALGSYFAATYLTAEVSMKLLSSIIPTVDPAHGEKVLFVVFTAVAFSSAAGILGIDSFGDRGSLGDYFFGVFERDRVTPSGSRRRRFLGKTTTADAGRSTAAPGAPGGDDDAEEAEHLAASLHNNHGRPAPPQGGGRASAASNGSSAPRTSFSFGSKATQAVSLFATDPKCSLMLPMNFAFGLGSAFVNGYFNRGVVSAHVGENAVGYVSSALVGAAAVFSLLYGALGRRLGGQAAIVAWGAVCYFVFAAINVVVPAHDLGHWSVVVLLACLFGNGRAVWEGNFKASIADYFPDHIEAAFANVQLQSGLASTVGFFMVLFADNPKIVVGAAVAVSSLAAIAAQPLAGRLHEMDQAAAASGHRRRGASSAAGGTAAAGGAYVRAPSDQGTLSAPDDASAAPRGGADVV
mmetsp:Transcript_11022/g.44673  ORF Transcript_11022/g.44673 Transcript_11022/m.44673 type:complete len:621 (+) Transcript_11022:58-1920(+)